MQLVANAEVLVAKIDDEDIAVRQGLHRALSPHIRALGKGALKVLLEVALFNHLTDGAMQSRAMPSHAVE